MSARTSGRQHKAVNYNEKAGGGGSAPAWALQLGGEASQQQKENARPEGASVEGRKSGSGKQPKAPAVAQKGRDAGLERLPIAPAEDGKAAKPSGKARNAQAPPAAAGKQVLPGVFVKAPAAAPAAAPKSGSGGKAAPAGPVQQAKSGSGGKAAAAAQQAKSGSGGKAAATVQQAKAGGSGKAAAVAQQAKSAPPAAAAAAAKSGGGSNGKRKAASTATDEQAGAAKSAPAALAGAAAKRQKAAPASAAAPAAQRAGQPAAADPVALPRQALVAQRGQQPAAAAPAAAVAAGAGDAPGDLAIPPGSDAEALVEQYSTNFRALQVEYEKLQALYEDLKAAKIDEEVQQLLEQQNRYVSEHGQKAAALVEHYKKEAQHHAATAAQLGGEALVEQCHRLQVDLMNCQQALLDKEAECLEKEKRLADMAARLAFLERFARVYDSSDKCLQTDDLPGEDASAQFPSLQSSGMEMLQAHALVPEGAGGGSIYRRPRAPAHPAQPSTSYTLPAGTPLAAAAAVAAAGMAAAVAAPISGSDMELTGGDATQQQQQPQPQTQQVPQQQDQALHTEPGHGQQAVQAGTQEHPQVQQQVQAHRRQSLQPVAGRVAHAAAGPALRPASAESQVQLAAPRPLLVQQRQQQPAGRRASMAPAPLAAAALVGSRRLSAPPAPIDRELHFTSASTAEAQGHAPLAAVPEQQALAAVPEEQPLEEGQASGEPQQEQAEPPLFEFPQLPAAAAPAPVPAASELTAPGAVARGGAPTPASVPAPPRHLAITALTGLTATPLKGGIYQYCDPRSGFVFELGPAAPDSTDLVPDGQRELRIRYRPVELGGAAALLPSHFHEELSFVESQKQNFFQQMMHSLNQRR